MCGIAGKINFDTNNSADPVLIKKMTDLITHRGPDSEGFYVYKNVGMGFRRLSIIDLNTGDQPISDASGNVTITFNGEIYNYLELKKTLTSKGYSFKTTTDTEVIVNLYLEYGKDCVKHLRGMFAFVIYDKRNNCIFGARDRFGIKPFYYSINNDAFIWGSELKCVKAGSGQKLNMDYSALDEYFTYGYIGLDKSVFTEVRKLKPAHSFTLDINKGAQSLEINNYWNIKYEPDYSKTENEWIELLDQKFAESIKMHMISDVPLGAFLSGGIDSSGVVAFMNKVSPGQVKTFSIGFKEQKFNELQYAREVAEKYKTEHHELILEPESVELLPRLVSAFDEPFADSSAIPTYYVSKFAREFVTVVLSGDGGDELFAGYNNYMKALSVKNSLFSNGLLNPFWSILHRTLPSNVSGKGLSYFLSKKRSDLGAYFCVMKKNERSSLFNDRTLNGIGNYSSEADRIQMLNGSSSKDFVSRLEELDLLNYLPGDILTKVDRTSMQNSLETRVPLLDHEFAELSFKIPSELKMNNNEGKLIFKKMLSKYLPENVMKHKKQGFGVPISIWFKDDLKAYVNDRLLNKNALIYAHLNYSAVSKIIGDQNFGMRDFSGQIWAMLFLEEWLKQNR
jgi:asparagine synthase (glutamine-hydrolysing)